MFKIIYPYKSSKNRQLNFTIAHEFGHLALDHTLSTEKKTQDEEALENLEADEFAGRFLLPEILIFTTDYYLLSSLLRIFNKR
jgi:Zn-dependent peptidase ImmA (M78 family)